MIAKALSKLWARRFLVGFIAISGTELVGQVEARHPHSPSEGVPLMHRGPIRTTTHLTRHVPRAPSISHHHNHRPHPNHHHGHHHSHHHRHYQGHRHWYGGNFIGGIYGGVYGGGFYRDWASPYYFAPSYSVSAWNYSNWAMGWGDSWVVARPYYYGTPVYYRSVTPIYYSSYSIPLCSRYVPRASVMGQQVLLSKRQVVGEQMLLAEQAMLDELFGPLEASVDNPAEVPEEVEANALFESNLGHGVQLAGWKAPKASELSSNTARVRAIRVERAKPALKPLTPTSPAWADSAIGTIDDLVLRGEFDAAMKACDSMSRNPKLPADIYLRHGLLHLFASREAVENDTVLDLFNAAAAGGCEMLAIELNCESVRIYIAPMDVSFDETLDQFSKMAMEDKSGSVDLLLLIATLLKLDGQAERSRFFAKEAFDRAAASGVLKWNSLTRVLVQE